MERFTRRDTTLVLVSLIAAAAAGVFAWTNFTRAFPEASLTFAVNRATSRPVAEAFVKEHAPAAAAAVANRRHAAVFRVEGQTKLYLEREVGLERLAELVRLREVRPWRWSHRYFLPLDKEEVGVDVTPEGEVVGFSHVVPEERPGASLEAADARALAESFLARVMGLDVTALEFIESHREDRKQRRDWTFTFERSSWTAADATYRMQVEVHGDEVAAYREFLKVPDAWGQSYQRLRSGNETAAMAAVLGIVLTVVAAVVVLLRAARLGNVRWRLAAGMTAVSFVLFAALALNDLPIAAYSFDTTESWGGFLAGQLLRAIGGAGVQSLLIFIVVAAGEPLYRARFPEKMRIQAIFSPAGWRSKRFAVGLILGYCLAVLFIAYQVGFYLVGRRFGAWNPADVPFDNLLNTTFPWLAVLFIGFYPAVSEEFMSRVFSIPLVEKLTRSKLLAVLVPAVIWGFAHANYPAQPFYIRGVEVAVAGILVGLVFYRFGVLPCLVWHYVVDAGYTSMLMVRSGNAYLMLTAIAGTGVLLVPLAAALIAAWRAGGFVESSALDNASDPPPPEPEAVAAARHGAITAPRAAWVLPFGISVAVAAAFAARWAPDPGKGVGVRLRPAEVREAARTFLERRGVDTKEWRLVVTATGSVLDRNVRRYLMEQGGVAEVARFAREVPPWRVRAFRPEEREEWQLAVDDATAAVVRFRHQLREESPAASLGETEARVVAEASLREFGLDPTALEFREAVAEQKPARLDHVFTYKDPVRSVGEAEYLISATVQGDRADAHERRIKLPEAWERARQKSTAVHYVLLGVKIAAIAWLLVHGLLTMIRAIKAGTVPWRPVWLGASAVGALIAAGTALTYPLAWQEYMTAWPLAVFRTSLVIGLVIAVVLQTALVVLILAMLLASRPQAAIAFQGRARRPVAASSFGAALAAIGVPVLLGAVVAVFRGALPRAFPDAPVLIPESLATALPVLANLGSAALEVLVVLTALAVIAHFAERAARKWHVWVLAAAVIVALVPSGADATALEFGAGLVQAGAIAGVAWLLVRFVLADNPAAYALAAGWALVLLAARPLLGQPGTIYVWQGLGVVAAAAVAGVVWARGRAEPAS